MTVYFVMGPSHSGKTSYVEEYLSEAPIVLDILDVQSLFQLRKNDEALRTSAILLKQALVFSVGKFYDIYDIVIEIPGINKKERSFYLDELKDTYPNITVIGIWIKTEATAVVQRIKNEKLEIDEEAFVEEQYSKIEIPETSEGFEDVIIFENNNEVQDIESQWRDQARKHLKIDASYPEAVKKLKEWYAGESDFYTYEKAGEGLISLAIDRKERKKDCDH